MEFDPLEGVGIGAVFIDATRGQFQAGAGRVGRHDAKGFSLVQMAAQQQVAMLVERPAGFQAVELGQIVERVVQQRDAPTGGFGPGGEDGLIDLVTPQQQAAPVFAAAGHPSRVQPGDVQPGFAETDFALPPRQGLSLAQPVA